MLEQRLSSSIHTVKSFNNNVVLCISNMNLIFLNLNQVYSHIYLRSEKILIQTSFCAFLIICNYFFFDLMYCFVMKTTKPRSKYMLLRADCSKSESEQFTA